MATAAAGSERMRRITAIHAMDDQGAAPGRRLEPDRTEDIAMARRDGGNGDRLKDAADRYRARFGADALPCLACVTDRAVPAVVALLDYAVATGRQMRHGQVAAALGEDGPAIGGGI
jgi:hypothetical protein